MKKQKGFTLLEAIVVGSIIAVLSALALVAIDKARLQACAGGESDVCEAMDITRAEAQKKIDGIPSNKVKNAFSLTEKEERCEKESKSCRYNCADASIDLDDCLKRCGIKKESCN